MRWGADRPEPNLPCCIAGPDAREGGSLVLSSLLVVGRSREDEQCVPFIPVSPVASMVPGTKRFTINVCQVQAREWPSPCSTAWGAQCPALSLALWWPVCVRDWSCCSTVRKLLIVTTSQALALAGVFVLALSDRSNAFKENPPWLHAVTQSSVGHTLTFVPSSLGLVTLALVFTRPGTRPGFRIFVD